jgi:glycosyltransferase involved in cell wall biosynthesis
MNPTVSVVVPARNRASLIEETLESIHQQTYSPIELLVVDDGSTDNTREIVVGWMERSKHPQCRLFPFPANVGKSLAVNLALGRVKGDFVMIVDSDDILLPDAVAAEVQFLQQHPDAGMVCARAYIMKGSEKTTETFDTFKDQASFDNLNQVYGDMLLKGNVVISSTALMRRAVVDSIGLLNVRLRYTHDWEYWIRVAEKFNIGFLARPLIYYRTEVAGASSLNRFGTFVETCELLSGARRKYDTPTLLKALGYQTKYNAWLAYKDTNHVEMIKIMFYGGFRLLKLMVGRRGR